MHVLLLVKHSHIVAEHMMELHIFFFILGWVQSFQGHGTEEIQQARIPSRISKDVRRDCSYFNRHSKDHCAHPKLMLVFQEP